MLTTLTAFNQPRPCYVTAEDSGGKEKPTNHAVIWLSGNRLDKSGHVGGSLLLYFGILYVPGWRGDTIETLALAIVAAAVAAFMAVKQDKDNFLWGIFHRTWITHSLTTVAMATGITYLAFDHFLPEGPTATLPRAGRRQRDAVPRAAGLDDEGRRAAAGALRRQKTGPALVQGQQHHRQLDVPGRGPGHDGTLLRTLFNSNERPTQKINYRKNADYTSLPGSF